VGGMFRAAPSAKRRISRIAYGLALAGLGLLSCGLVVWVTSVGLVANRLLPGGNQTASGVGIALACLGGLGMAASLATFLRLRQPIQVEVKHHAITLRDGRKTTKMAFDEIKSVVLVVDYERHHDDWLAYPVIRFSARDGTILELDVSFEDREMVHRAPFDVQGIAQAVLPYLPPSVSVAEAVVEFAQTGYVALDELPDRE
jgi:hypothetical protein